MEIKRKQRTSVEQLENYLSFLEENPQFKAGKNTPENPKYLEEKWAELEKNLNMCRGPAKSSKEWKLSLNHWKYQVKSKARKLKEDLLITGGGEATTASLTKLEERAPNLFGMVSVTGDTDIIVLGEVEIRAQAMVTNEQRSFITEVSGMSIQSISTQPIQSHNTRSTIVSGNSTSGKCKSTINAITDCVQKIQVLAEERTNHEQKIAEQRTNHEQKIAEQRTNHEQKIAEQRLAIDKQNADALTRMAEALFVIAKQVEANNNRNTNT